jgi:hypothetical protein
MTSPWAREPRPQITGRLVLSLRNLTEPSASRTLAPPGWRLLRVHIPGFQIVLDDPESTLQFGVFGFGARTTLPMLKPGSPQAQPIPSCEVWLEVRSAPRARFDPQS